MFALACCGTPQSA